MRLMFFLKLLLIFTCASLLFFAFTEATLITLLKMIAGGTVLAVAVSIVYPEVRGIKNGDVVSVVRSSGIPSLIGRLGRAMQEGRKNNRIKVRLDNGNEVVGLVESYDGIITPPKIRVIYEEKLVE